VNSCGAHSIPTNPKGVQIVRLRRLVPPARPHGSSEAADVTCAYHALGRIRHTGSILDTRLAHLSYEHCRYGGRPFRMFRWVLKCYVPARPHIYPS
jgi:hypothetical protein